MITIGKARDSPQYVEQALRGEAWFADGFTLDGNANHGSVITESVIAYQKIFSPAYLQNLYIANYSAGVPGVDIGPGNRPEGAGPIKLDNLWINPNQNAPGIRIRDHYGAVEGYTSEIWVSNVAIENTGTEPAIVAQANSLGQLRALNVVNLRCSSNGTGPCATLENAYATSWTNVTITPGPGQAEGITLNSGCYANEFIAVVAPGGYGDVNVIVDAQTGLTTPNTVQKVSYYSQQNNSEDYAYLGPYRVLSGPGITSNTTGFASSYGLAATGPITSSTGMTMSFETAGGTIQSWGGKPLFLNPAGNTVKINGGSNGKGFCQKSDGYVGYCSTALDANGNCTCN